MPALASAGGMRCAGAADRDISQDVFAADVQTTDCEGPNDRCGGGGRVAAFGPQGRNNDGAVVRSQQTGRRKLDQNIDQITNFQYGYFSRRSRKSLAITQKDAAERGPSVARLERALHNETGRGRRNMSVASGRRNLVITRAGANSLHSSWLSPPLDRNFDLLVAAYDEKAIEADSDGVEHLFIPGFKVAGWRKLFETHSDILDRYDRIALLDDDLETCARDISTCFDIGAERGLALWQPSLTWDSFATFGATLSNPALHMRYINCVEMMCPFFRSDELRRVVPIFSLGFETGVDLIWNSLVSEPLKVAVLDCIEVRHTRPVGGEKSRNGFAGREYEDDIYACLECFEAKWPSAVSATATSRDMREISSPFAIGLRTLALAPSILKAPRGSRLYRARSVADHIRHQFTRRGRYIENATAILGRLTAERRLHPP